MEKEKIIKIMKKSAKNAPVFKTKKYFSNPFEGLIFTMLSSRTKDNVTIKICNKLFKKIKNFKDLLKEGHLEKMLKGVAFYKTKAKNLKKIAKIIIKKYKGKIPKSKKILMSLPGIGEKTASIIMNNCFKIPDIGVDVHVHRIINRLGWIKSKNPKQTYTQIKKKIPKKLWKEINISFVAYGQTICSKKPKCNLCKIRKWCKYYSSISEK